MSEPLPLTSYNQPSSLTRLTHRQLNDLAPISDFEASCRPT